MEELHDKQFGCVDCGDKFIFRKEEQTYFMERGYPEPKRCFKCRRAKRKRKRKAIKEMKKTLKTAESVRVQLITVGAEEQIPMRRSKEISTVRIVQETVAVAETATMKTEKSKKVKVKR